MVGRWCCVYCGFRVGGLCDVGIESGRIRRGFCERAAIFDSREREISPILSFRAVRLFTPIIRIPGIPPFFVLVIVVLIARNMISAVI